MQYILIYILTYFFVCKILSLLIRGIQEYSYSGKANILFYYILITKQPDSN